MAKRFSAIFLCIAMLASLVSVGVTAESSNWSYVSPEMQDYEVTYYSMGSASSAVKGGNRLTFTSKLAERNTTEKLYVSFPEEGGIRVYSDRQGFFNPNGLCRITYTTLSSKVIKLKPDNSNLTAVFDYSSTPWKLTVTNSENGNNFSLSGANVFFGYDSSNALKKVKLTGGILSDEVIFGLGERYNGFNQVGKKVPLWNTDTGYHTWTANSGDKAYSYVNVPLMHSNSGYSLFFNLSYSGTADIGNTVSNVYSLEFAGDDFDFYTYLGTPLENTESYTALTGRPAASPTWSFGYWAGGSFGDGETYINKVKNVLSGYKSMGMMPTAIYLESIPFNEQGLEIANSYGVRGLTWNNPSQAQLLQSGMNGTTFSQENLKVLLPDVSQSSLPWSYDNYWGDYTNPLMNTALKNGGYSKLLKVGLSGAMVDYGEYINNYGTFYNGMTGEEMHNFYPYYYNKAIAETFSSVRGDDYVLFARAGCAGSQQFAASFGGDVNSSFDGLKAALYAGLSISASGFSTWGSDLGGYYCSDSAISDELYQRWLEFSLFSPLMRLHGNTEKDPWNFSEQAQQTFKAAYSLRNNILDLLYSANITANTTGAPMMQAMALAFPEQKELAAIEDQYLFCNELLVCPVVTAGATSRTINLPTGRWTSLWNGELYYGGSHTVSAAVNEIPVYIRAGAVMPVTLSESYSLFEQPENGGIAALVLTPADETRTVSYMTDSGEAYSFESKNENGVYTVTSGEKVIRSTLVLAGVDALGVTVDGTALKRLSSLSDGEIGYYVDKDNNRTLVNADTAWQSLEYTEGEVYTNDFSDTRVSSAVADFGIYFAAGDSKQFVAETAEQHFSTANGNLARVTDPNGFSDRDIDRNILSAVLLNAKYNDFVLDATIAGTHGGASSLGFVIGQKMPGEHYMNSENGGYAVFFKRFGNQLNLAVVYNGKTVLSGGSLSEFSRNGFVGTLDDFYNNFGCSDAGPLRVRLEVVSGNLQAYVYSTVQKKYVKIGGTIPLNSYSGGYIALAQSTAQVTNGAPNDQYYDSLCIKGYNPEIMKRSDAAVITPTEYRNSFNNSSVAMLENDFDIYYAENQLNNKVYKKEEVADFASRLYITDGWLGRYYQGGNNWQPYLGNVILRYKHAIYGNLKTEFTNRFLAESTLKSTYMTVQIGQQSENHSVYDSSDASGGYLVTLQLCGAKWAAVTVVHCDKIIYKAALGTEAEISGRTGYDTYVVIPDYSSTNVGKFSVQVNNKQLLVTHNGSEVISGLLLEDYNPGFVSVGFDIGNPDSGTAIDDLSIIGEVLPIEFTKLCGSSASLKKYYGYEYSTDGINFCDETDFTGLLHNNEYVFYQRTKATENYPSGNIVCRTITVKYLPGDFNGNNLYQSDDLVMLRRVLLGALIADKELSDVNKDSSVNILDLVRLKKTIIG